MNNPLISIIVPVYKVEPYLDCCIKSIVEQTYSNLEIILVDDGSPDNCGSICDAWAEKDGRIVVIHKENGGLSDARNAGLKIAKGEYIAFVDSDDRIASDFLSELLNAINDTGADISECAVNYISESGTVTKTRFAAAGPIDRIEALRRLILEDGVYQTVWNKLYRREVLGGIMFEKDKYNEDDFWTYLIFDRINNLASVNKPLYNYLQRRGSIIGSGYSVKRLDGLEARFRRMQYLQKYDELATLSRQQLILDCMWHLQCVLRCLDGEEQKSAKHYILDLIKSTPKMRQSELVLNFKYRVWYAVFVCCPVGVAGVRNLLKIGL